MFMVFLPNKYRCWVSKHQPSGDMSHPLFESNFQGGSSPEFQTVGESIPVDHRIFRFLHILTYR